MAKKTETKKKEETIVEETNKTIVTDNKSEDKKLEIKNEKKLEKEETYEELFYKEKIVRLLCAKYENGTNFELSYKKKYDYFNKIYNELVDKIEEKVTKEYNENNR